MLLTQFVFCVYASMDLERMVSLRLSVAAGGYHTSLSSPATTQYDTIGQGTSLAKTFDISPDATPHIQHFSSSRTL